MDFELSYTATRLAGVIFGKLVNQVVPIERGVMTFKFLVYLADGMIYVMRFYPLTRAYVVHYEPDLIKRFHDHGLPVPKMFCDSRTGPRSGWEYCIYEYVQGTPLSDRLASMNTKSIEELACSLVSVLTKISELEISGFGELVDSKHAKHNKWNHYLENVFSTGIAAIEAGNTWPRRLLTDLRRIQSRIHSVPPPDVPQLALGDISPENVLIDANNCLAGLLDFEGAIVSEPLLNLGYSYARHIGTSMFDAMLHAWPVEIKVTHSIRVNLYAVLRALSIAPYAGTPLPSGVKRSPINNFLPGLRPAMEFLLAKL